MPVITTNKSGRLYQAKKQNSFTFKVVRRVNKFNINKNTNIDSNTNINNITNTTNITNTISDNISNNLIKNN